MIAHYWYNLHNSFGKMATTLCAIRGFLLSMAHRRMFSPDIVSSEEFLSMPVSSRELYFQLGMNADDDGFIQPKLIMRIAGATEDDLKVLLAKRFLLPFQSGVVVIKHWLIHNMIRVDRYKPTRFQEEKGMLFIKENKAYTDKRPLGLQNGNQLAPQVRLGKVRLIIKNSESLDSGVEDNSRRLNSGQSTDGLSKGKLSKDILLAKTPSEKNMNHYDENNPDGESYDIDPITGNSIPKKAKKPHPLREDAEKLVKLYMEKYKSVIGGVPHYYPKPAYLKQVYPVLEKYGYKKLEELLSTYLNSDNEIYKQNKWSISCFLSWKVLAQLHD